MRLASHAARLLACLLACLPATPAWAAAPAAEEPEFHPVLLPVPLVALAAGFGYHNFPIGPTRHDVRVLAGYFWSRNFYYDPLATAPRELETPLGRHVEANTWQLRGAWGWRLTPGVTLFLEGLGIGGGPAATGGYDDPLLGGWSASAGPVVQLSSLDHLHWPRRGAMLRAGWARGWHEGPAAFAFDRGHVDLMHFTPLGAHATVALRAVGQVAGPQLAWVDKFQAGGGMALRGFQWNRFTGDRLLAATAEYRRIVEPDLLGRLGLAPPGLPLKVGLASATYVDFGRAWEGRAGAGVPFPLDTRVGGGTGLIALVNGIPAGRVELNVSGEGVFPVASGGASF